eukprot:4881010-Amphidinium_carterae.1
MAPGSTTAKKQMSGPQNGASFTLVQVRRIHNTPMHVRVHEGAFASAVGLPPVFTSSLPSVMSNIPYNPGMAQQNTIVALID